MAFQVQVPIEGALTDSMIWRSGLESRVPAGSGSPLRAGRRSRIPGGGQCRLDGGAVVVLVADAPSTLRSPRGCSMMSRKVST
jgi:hypothetical protein